MRAEIIRALRYTRIIGLGMALFASSALADGITQIISVASEEVVVGPDATNVSFEISYTTDPVEEQATGVDVKIFYDSSVLEFGAQSAGRVDAGEFVEGTEYEITKTGTTDFTAIGAADSERGTVFTATGAGEGSGQAEEVCKVATQTCFNADLSSFLTGYQDQADEDDGDADASTDRFILVAYFQIQGEFPGFDVEFPVAMFSQNFKKVDAAFEGTTGINFSANPASGNTAEVPATFGIRFKGDEVPPEITLAETSVTVEAVGPLTSEDNSTELATFIETITVTDNKDTLTTGDINAFLTNDDGELEAVAEEGLAPGTYEVTLKAVDSSGNESEAVVITVTIVDTTAPLLSGVNDITLAAVDANGAASAGQLQAAASDLVDGAVEIVLSVGGEALPQNFPLGATEVTVTATDAAGNTSSDTLTVTVTDQTAPVIVSASGVTFEATGAEGYTGTTDSVIAAIVVSDNVDAAPTVALGDGVGSSFGFTPTDVAITVTDAAGNSTPGTVTVTVVDTTAPEFSGANQLVLTIDAETEAPVASSDERVNAWLAGVTASDLVDGETAVTNSELPAGFPVGPTTITFTSSDAAGNEATKEVIVLVAVGPAVSVADSITVVSLDGEAVAASQVQIAAFIAAASATDFSGNALDVTNDAPDSFPLGETVVTFSAVDSDDRQGQNSASVTVIAANGDTDTDGDGIDDLFEVENSLDPNNAEDGEADADGDGRSNLDEYLEGKDPNADDVAPVVTAPADVSASSTGPLTSVVLGDATAVDTLDGDLTPTADNPGPYAPGSVTVTWTATDAAGNVGSAEQQVVVLPQVSTVPRGRTAEGEAYVVSVALNGPASSYPVEVPVTLAGTADLDTDYTISADTIVIEAGRTGSMTITVIADEVDEGTEVIEVTLGEPASGAVLGTATSSSVSIVETAEPPALRLAVSQGEQKGRKVSAAGGAVVVALSINDPNGTHTVDWSSSDEALVATSEAGAGTYEFDPAELAEGGYEVTAIVTDSGIADETFAISARLFVKAEAVEADSDGDGVPDSKDTSEESNVIAVNADEGSAAVTADEGVTLVLGDAAQASDTAGIALSEETIAENGADGSGAAAQGADEDFDYPAGVYDFQVQDLPVPGQSVRLVIPVAGGIPADAVMRKYTDADGWFDFVIDDNNAVASAAGTDGACPSVGSELYVAGLAEGDTCLQLTVQDGGPNDADGAINGEYDDPSGIAEAAPVQVVEVPKQPANAPKVGGGCSVSQGPGDFGLLLLAMLGLLGLARKRLRLSPTR